jgi:chorismate synthase
MGIQIGAHIRIIAGNTDQAFDPLKPELDRVSSEFPVISMDAGMQMRAAIAEAQAQGDSVGGEIECAITGLLPGIGEPMFGGVESRLAQILYGIPAVKYLEFGAGQKVTSETGSTFNDPFTIVNGRVVTQTNNSGGILGGITNGMPVIFRIGIKPTPSISRPQESVNLNSMETVPIQIKGRHDPCIVPRAVPVVEAAAAIAIYDLILGNTQTYRRKQL